MPEIKELDRRRPKCSVGQTLGFAAAKEKGERKLSF
jgi:hypothetical protein